MLSGWESLNNGILADSDGNGDRECAAGWLDLPLGLFRGCSDGDFTSSFQNHCSQLTL